MDLNISQELDIVDNLNTFLANIDQKLGYTSVIVNRNSYIVDNLAFCSSSFAF